jgi:hypothetical protein
MSSLLRVFWDRAVLDLRHTFKQAPDALGSPRTWAQTGHVLSLCRLPTPTDFLGAHLWLLKLPGPHNLRVTKISRKQKAMHRRKNNEHRNLSMLSLLHSMNFFSHNDAEHLLLL